MRKIVYISYQPLNSIITATRFVHDFVDEGVDIEYWDVTDLFFDRSKFNKIDGYEKYIKYFGSYTQLEEAIQEYVSHTVFIILITYDYNVIKLFKLLTKKRCITAFIVSTMLPFGFDQTLFQRLTNKISYLFKPAFIWRKLKESIAIIYKKMGWVKHHDYVFLIQPSHIAGVGRGNNMDKKKSQLIYINSYEYDAALALDKKQASNQQKEAIVFIDSYLPYHPDLKLMNWHMDASTYFDNMNKLFQKMETHHNTDVIILAHPKADYSINPYNNRTIIYNQTLHAIKKSTFVLSHASSAIHYAVHYNKPIFFIIMDEMKNLSSFYHGTVSTSTILNAKLLDLSKEFDTNLSATIDTEKYEIFKSTYLRNEQTKHKLSKDIILETFRKIT